MLSDMDQTSLLSLAQQSNVLRQEARLVILQSRQTTDRFTQLAQLFFQTLSIVSFSVLCACVFS